MRKSAIIQGAVFLIVLVTFTAFTAAGAQSQKSAPQVIVFPFATYVKSGPPNMEKVIQDLLVQQLTEQGLRAPASSVIAQKTGVTRPVRSESQARSLARRLGGDYALIGSLSQVGNSFSLDAKLVDVSGRQRTRTMFSEKRGIENLASAAQEISQQVAVNLLAKAIIADVRVKGNERIEADAILVKLKSQKGELLRSRTVREDIKTIYKMGYFESVRAEVEDGPEGKILTFVVREKPSVVEVRVKGNKKIKDKDILAAISTKPFTILQKNVVNNDVQKIIKLYHQKAYFNAEVKADIEFPKDPRQAVVTFNIKENKRVYIKHIDFEGNEHFSAWKLRRVMETKTKSIFFWFTDRGVLQKDVLETDTDRLAAYYHDHGYMDVKVGTPRIDRKEDGFYITIPIHEGQRYRVESVEITGDKLDSTDAKGITTDDLLKKLELKPGDYFSREKLRKDLGRITKAYMNEGYAYAEIVPDIRRSPDTAKAMITYKVRKGPKVYIESVSISGNTKTRDKVIRRELQLAPGDQFSGKKLERSNLNLRRLDFFEEVEIQPSEGSRHDTMNLHVKVKEKATGSLSVGGGFSSDDGLFLGGNVLQRNLFGRGQYLALKAYVSKQNVQYSLSFTEPWLFDRPLSAGFDAYNWYREYTDFTKDAIGGKLRFGHPFGSWSRWRLAYVYEDANVTDVADDAATIIKDQEGRQVKSSIMGSIERNTTDHPFMPTRGSINSLSMEYSCPYLGSDSDFIKYIVNSGWYFPLMWKCVGFIRGKMGWIVELDKDKPVPIYDRFFLGGLNSLRAFDWGDVGPQDSETGDNIGGTKFGLVNIEFLFPLIEKMAMRGVLFFDAGNAFDSDENLDVSKFRTDVGAGIRWNSPMGPIRIEYAVNLDRKPGESSGKWQFSMGAFF